MDSEYIQQYQRLEQEKELRKKWIGKVNSCSTCKELCKIIQDFKAENLSGMSRDDLEFYFFNFISHDKEKASAIIMQCLAYDWEIIDARTLFPFILHKRCLQHIILRQNLVKNA